ncbi:MAG: hypothetical protein ACR2GY_11045 [Phycisphaerales bacterium]
MSEHPRQCIDPQRTTWHITFGTYGTRLHGGNRATVDRCRNQPGNDFAARDAAHEEVMRSRLKGEAIYLTFEERCLVERAVPGICDRGGWILRTCAAGPEGDHVHVLLDAEKKHHGKDVRKWLKRWLSEALTRECGAVAQRWWAKGGSTKAVKDEVYLNRAFMYVREQRASDLL